MIYNLPQRIYYGWAESKKIGELAKDIDIKKALIVTDKDIQKIGLLKEMERSLNNKKIDYLIYNDVQPNPTDKNVEDGLKIYKDENCDSIIAFGGGSTIDAAKGVLVIANHPGILDDYFSDSEYKRDITKNVPKFIAIPTTSGTGSEVSCGAIITDTEINRKRVIRSQYLLPKIVILDPKLTLTMPKKLTAYTGLDALSHSFEAFVIDSYAPISDAFAREGIRLIKNSLIKAYNDGENKRAREDMMMASSMGALAFQKGLGAIHSLAHQLSTQKNIPHGLACGIMLPKVIEFNMESGPAKKQVIEKYAEITKIFGINISEISLKKAAEKSIEEVNKILKKLDIDPKLRNFGINEEDIDTMAKKAMLDHCHKKNPRKCDKEIMASLYRSAL